MDKNNRQSSFWAQPFNLQRGLMFQSKVNTFQCFLITNLYRFSSIVVYVSLGAHQ